MTGPRLLHVAIADDWEACARFGEYTVSTRQTSFEEAGYLRATTASQVSTVLEKIYGDLDLPLVLVVIDEDALAGEGIDVTWEDTTVPGQDTTVTPRIMAELPMEEPFVAAVIPLHRAGGHWMDPDLTGLNVRETSPRT